MHRTPRTRARRALVAVTASAALTAAGAVLVPTEAQAAAEQISNGTFEDGLAPWYAYGVDEGSLRVEDGALCADVPAGTVNPWDAAIGIDAIPTQADTGYTLSFKAKATKAVAVNANFQHGTEDYEIAAGGVPLVGTDWDTYSYSGTSALEYENGQVVFQIGGKGAFTFCIDDVSLLGGTEPPKYEPETGPVVRVNQVGYLPNGPKFATVVTDSKAPVAWRLKDAKDAVVATGKAVPKGKDATSGLKVQVIDFSSVTKEGTFTLSAANETSYPFQIKKDLYESLRKDSKLFFYTQRSGTPILGTVAGDEYARAAGHIGVAPNMGDTKVPCTPKSTVWDNWTCTIKRDVSGGWYDAGDHGKYVVNGGISVAQLLGEYERNRSAFSADTGALRDGTLRVPEQGNKVPDILDEARWELEFLLKMQVPAGQKYVGMAYQKVHDAAWTGLPLDPAADNQPRQLHRPSTAATLNLAAAAAQGARVFSSFDKPFADKLLTASKKAYAAAKANPKLYAPATDGTGGGAYDDSNVSDEFYWAAAELYITTGADVYRKAVQESPLHTGDVFSVDGFGWQSVGALGRLDLATVNNHLPGRGNVRRSVVAAADKILAVQRKQQFGQPYAPETGFVWGSNSNLLNNMVVLGSAFDISGKKRFLEGVLTGADYLFGRNALNISYVTGYGTVFSQNQHSRMYAHSLNPDLPAPPIGSVAGGPNREIQDPVAAAKLADCVDQFCYIDDIGSYATNEVAINWNAALSWVSSFLADQETGATPTGVPTT